MSKVPKFCFEDSPPAKPAKVAKLYSTESPQATSEVRPVTCESCPWYDLNPWTHYPDFGAWCHFRMEHLVVGRHACEEFDRKAVPIKATPNPAPLAPAPGERVLKTMDRTRARAARLF
jgi:hypothetical protein